MTKKKSPKKNKDVDDGSRSTPPKNIKFIDDVDDNYTEYTDDDTRDNSVIASSSKVKVDDSKKLVTMEELKDALQTITTTLQATKDKGKKPAIEGNESDGNHSSGSSTFSRKVMLAEQNLTNQLYTEIPKYDGEGDIQKLMEFIDKVENYLEMVEFSPLTEVKAVTSKLIGAARLLWRYHRKLYPDREAEGRIKT